MKITACLFFFLFSLPLTFCHSQNKDTDRNYTYERGDPNGTGKWYMGREIAYVMGYQGISWLERPEREKEEQTTALLRNMDIDTGDCIADIGAGSGYHVFKIAPLVNRGIVYAVDIQEGMLTALRERQEKEIAENVRVIKGSEQTVKLPENSVDKVLMVDVYHEFANPREMMASVRKALRPGGRLYLIEYRGEDPRVPIKKVHKMTEVQAVREMKAAGMKLEKNISNLPWQHCMVFIKG